MTGKQQRDALQRQIWKIANDVRGAVDGWDFKQYVLGTLFYRFISEHFALYIEADDDSINYASLADSVITPEIKDDAIKTKGYFIYPSQLFVNVAKTANTNVIYDDHIQRIMDMFDSKEKVDHVAETVPYEKIVANDYNLSVSSYIEAKENREVTNINELNADIETTVGKINQLRTEIDAIVNEIEGASA
jgi:type I restriction-modification system DNA methylase subunit